MSTKLKALSRKRSRERLNKMTSYADNLQRPKGGWIRFVRESLGMTGSQLGKRLGGITKESISQKEKAELDNSITLKALEEAAEAMGCKLVYAIVPEDTIDQVISRQADKHARAIVKKASIHMSLEDQALSQSKLDERIMALRNELIMTVPKDLWND